jgi:hypothetical protein
LLPQFINEQPLTRSKALNGIAKRRNSHWRKWPLPGYCAIRA